jgi:hypothetical protein
MAKSSSLTNTRELTAFALSHLFGWIVSYGVYPLVYAYLNSLGAAHGHLLTLIEIRIVGVLMAMLMTLIILAIFLLLRRPFAGAVQTGITTGKEIAIYLAAHAVGLIIVFSTFPSIYLMLQRMGRSADFAFAVVIMNTIVFSIVLVLFVVLRRALGNSDVDEERAGTSAKS